jgi:hypothetical protein
MTWRDVTPFCNALYPQHLAQPKLVPIVASVSELSPGLHLIEVDTVYVVSPRKPWFAPVTWLLPDDSPRNVHMKIGVAGSLENGKVGCLQSVCQTIVCNKSLDHCEVDSQKNAR